MNANLHIFPTLDCNGGCDFCAITPGKGERSRLDFRYMPPERWAWILAARNPNTLYITGGEPLLYQGLAVIVNGVGCPVNLYTNGSGNLQGFLARVENTKRLRVRLSFHPHIGYKNTMRAIDTLNESAITYSVHMVKASDGVLTWVTRFQSVGITLNVDPDFRREEVWCGPSTVDCHIPNIVVGPDGMVYQCTSKMVRGVGALFSLEEDRPVSEKAVYRCEEPGACCACDTEFYTVRGVK